MVIYPVRQLYRYHWREHTLRCFKLAGAIWHHEEDAVRTLCGNANLSGDTTLMYSSTESRKFVVGDTECWFLNSSGFSKLRQTIGTLDSMDLGLMVNAVIYPLLLPTHEGVICRQILDFGKT